MFEGLDDWGKSVVTQNRKMEMNVSRNINVHGMHIGNILMQLRLRNLTQVFGYNIKADSDSMLYFTLHATSMSPPFYTSKMMKKTTIKANTKIYDEGNELNGSDIVVWEELTNDNFISKIGWQSAAKCVCIRIWQHTPEKDVNDKEIIFWGLYFSGLTPMNGRFSKKFQSSTIIFRMFDKYFTSSDCIINTSVASSNPSSNTCDNVEEKIENSKINNEIYNMQNFVKEEPERKENGKVNFNEHSTINLKPSYDIKKLLSLQIIQRSKKYQLARCKELSEKICMKSAFCLNIELYSSNMSKYIDLYRYQNSQNRGMGKQLSKLLFQEKIPPSPEIMLKCQKLRRNIENESYRCKILTQEKERIRFNMKLLHVKISSISDYNIEIESWLMSHLRHLSRDKENVSHLEMIYSNEKEIYSNVVSLLTKRQHYLLKGLSEIYCIHKMDNDYYAINEILLPNAESYQTADNLSALAINVALGYVCHAVLMCSTILNIPLRNQIKHEGSKSKVVDNVKILPASETEFPLYCRSSQISNSLLYAVFLLNQNISQIKYMLGLSRGDLRATLRNLFDIMRSKLKGNTSEFHQISSTDSNTTLHEHTIVGKTISSPRISRSMDDYIEKNIYTLNSKKENKSRSDPLLYN